MTELEIYIQQKQAQVAILIAVSEQLCAQSGRAKSYIGNVIKILEKEIKALKA